MPSNTTVDAYAETLDTADRTAETVRPVVGSRSRGGRERARSLLLRELRQRAWSNAQLADEAGVNRKTVDSIFSGQRWPQRHTQNKIEKALDWPPGTIEAIDTGAIDEDEAGAA